MELLQALVVGVVVGGSYALLALGVSLIFSTTGVLSFAQAAFAMFAAYFYSWASAEKQWNPWLAALVAVAIGTVYGLAVERIVIRQIAESSPVTRMVATVGVLAVTQGVVLQLFGFQPKAAESLAPEGSIFLGDLGISYQQLLVLGTTAVLVALLAAFLTRTRLGLAVRASAQSPGGSRLVGIDRVRIARLNWGAGAFLASVAGVLIAPLTIISVATFPGLLLGALAGSLFGAVGGLTLAVVGGFSVGALEALAANQTSTIGIRSVAVLGLVLLLLIVRRRWPADLTAAASIEDAGAARRPFGPGLLVILGLAGWAVYRSLTDTYWASVGIVALVYGIAALALVLLTGWAGQLSLMHGMLLGVGAFGLAEYLDRWDLPLAVAVLLAGITAAVVAGLVSLVGLRLRGAQLIIVTLAVAAAGSNWLFELGWLERSVQRPDNLMDDRRLFAVLLGAAALFTLVTVLLRHGPWGRALQAVARSDSVAEHFGANPHLVRFQAWVLSGFMTGVAGALYGLYLTVLQPSMFGVLLSISLLLYVVTCGRASLLGPVVVVLLFGYGPAIYTTSQTNATAIPSIISGVAVVAILAFFPTGLADLVARWRPRGTARRVAPTPSSPTPAAAATPTHPEPAPAPAARPLKRSRELVS
ncbi:ABC transporter permease [Sporichthya polymorpha]|uniref:ABC transporter permease n=1 Tax=Sporichthya polymorpha TaxID=35751 RepID=UPI000377523C|nr:ABC transporter permease [Sporichthya polymorpha]